jgi:hypothetical protein
MNAGITAENVNKKARVISNGCLARRGHERSSL